MVTKRKPGQKKGKAKVGKLKLNKETVKELTDSDLKQVAGGKLGPGSGPLCTRDFYCQDYPSLRVCKENR